MKKNSSKVKKPKMDWRLFLFHLHQKELSEAFTLFCNDHPGMSTNRCAYYVLKSYYFTFLLDFVRTQRCDYGWTEEQCANIFDIVRTPWSI